MKKELNEINFGNFENPKRSIQVHSIKQLYAKINEKEELFEEQMNKVKDGKITYNETELFIFKAQHEHEISVMKKDLKHSIDNLPKQENSDFVKSIQEKRKNGTLKQK